MGCQNLHLKAFHSFFTELQQETLMAVIEWVDKENLGPIKKHQKTSSSNSIEQLDDEKQI